jgi:integrase
MEIVAPFGKFSCFYRENLHCCEALSVRIKDLDFKSNPAKVFVRGEYTKTRTDRIVFLTEEMAQQLNSVKLQVQNQKSML